MRSWTSKKYRDRGMRNNNHIYLWIYMIIFKSYSLKLNTEEISQIEKIEKIKRFKILKNQSDNLCIIII